MARWKAEKKEHKEELDALKAGGKVGPHEIWWSDMLTKAGIRSEVYHGGDWAGHACRQFLGASHKVESRPDAIAKTYVGLYEALRKRITAMDEGGIDTRVKREDLLEFVTVLETLCAKLVTAHNFYTSIKPIFAREWGCVGRFAEDVVESMHRQINQIVGSLTNLSNQPLELMQAVDDRLNLVQRTLIVHADIS